MKWFGLVLAAALAGCISVDETEWCVETRYGKVVTDRMGVGLTPLVINDATCFTMTERSYPSDTSNRIQAMTSDPLTVNGDVAIVYRYNPATFFKSVYLTKRTPAAAETEIMNAIQEGYRNAVAGWTVQEIADNRAALADSVKEHIQRKLGDLAEVRQAYVRDIDFPEAIETARIEAVQRASQLDAARKQLAIDSTQAAGQVIRARAVADAKRLEADAYSQNSRLIEVEVAKHLSKICASSATCILGGSALDKLFLTKP